MLGRSWVAVSSRRMRAPLALSLVAIATACSTGLDIESATGVWGLQTVNGETLPVVLSDDGNTVVSISGAIFVIRIETCILSATYFSTVGGTPQQPEDIGLTCTWNQNGTDVSFDFGDPETNVAGTIEGGSITVTNLAGFVFVYRRV